MLQARRLAGVVWHRVVTGDSGAPGVACSHRYVLSPREQPQSHGSAPVPHDLSRAGLAYHRHDARMPPRYPLRLVNQTCKLGVNTVQSTSFSETQTVLAALEFALKKGGFGAHANQKKTAQKLIKDMKSTKSVSGRHAQIMQMLKKGSSIDQLIKATGSSRRTIFRYLNHFEEAGVDIELIDGRYRIS